MLPNPITMAKRLLIHQEGLRLKPYYDSTGHLTIGVGRNLTANGISEAEAMHLLANDIVRTYRELSDKFPWYSRLDDVRQLALLSMAFNLGMGGLLGFKIMLAALADKRYKDAASAALNSKWATQVGHRAVEIADMLKTGKLPAVLDAPT